VESTLTSIPFLIRKMFSCEHCDWRKNNICPYGYKPGKPVYKGKGKNIMHLFNPEGKTAMESGTENIAGIHICLERVRYIKAMYGGMKKKCTADEWMEYYNAYMANEEAAYHRTRMNELLRQKAELLGEINEFDTDNMTKEASDKLKKFESAYHKADMKFSKYLGIAHNIISRKLDRDKPKKIDMDIKHISIRDVFDAVADTDKDDIIDAESRDID